VFIGLHEDFDPLGKSGGFVGGRRRQQAGSPKDSFDGQIKCLCDGITGVWVWFPNLIEQITDPTARYSTGPGKVCLAHVSPP